ncbi:hypothetical protein IFM89_019494 [Coptis chinensis]|uniref:TF-B3 domain-containing protein n=1 Tax=Coptis chinensis TaxID=261450 RepID=A0A835LBD9_9MAGN|nr:hypothetical protein IFM89_019494 [Coptis chinensis]
MESYLERKEEEDNNELMPPALQDDILSQLEKGGGILPPDHEVEKKIDNGKRKLKEIEEYDDDYQENVEPNYFNKKKQKKPGKGRKTTTNKSKERVSKKERAPEPEKPEGMRYFIAQMQGKDIEWVNTKDITLSDTLKQQNRLYMPNEVVEILREEEKEKDEPFEVHVLDPRGNVWKQNFRYWKEIRRYVLNKKWHDFVKENKLELVNGDKTIEIWSFRNHYENLCFAINIRLREKHASAEEKGVGQTGNSYGGNGGGAFTNGASTSARGGSKDTDGAGTNSFGACGDSGGGGGGGVTNEVSTSSFGPCDGNSSGVCLELA